MKRTSKALALLLALVMVFSCISVQAFAATKETVMQVEDDGGYLAVGDSIAWGMGTDAWLNGGFGYESRDVAGTIPKQVADAVGCEYVNDITGAGNFWKCAVPGMTLGAFADLVGIEDDFIDYDFAYTNYDWMLEYYGADYSSAGAREEDDYVALVAKHGGKAGVGEILDLAKKANVITVELGMCDVFYRPLVVLSGGGSFAAGNLFSNGITAEFVSDFVGEMIKGYNYFVEYYPQVIAKLKQANPDAQIVIVGAFNLIQDLKMDDMITPIGNAAAIITNDMNNNYKEWAQKYGCLYADISNVETYAAEAGYALLGEEYMANSDRASHPSQNGHAYIARQILSVLPEETEPEHEWASTDIVVDLGRFNRVDKVYVDGVEFTEGTGLGCYEMHGYNIVCHYGFGYATTLRVQIVGEDGKVVTQIYSLSYQNGGYVADRVYGDDDTEETNSKFVQFFKDIFQKIADFFANLFK